MHQGGKDVAAAGEGGMVAETGAQLIKLPCIQEPEVECKQEVTSGL